MKHILFAIAVFYLDLSFATPITGIQIVGSPVLVFDHLKDKQEPNHIPDSPAMAWKTSDGKVSLTITHHEFYRMRGGTLDQVSSEKNKLFSSASEIPEERFNYHHWIHSPYTLDGKTIYALVHSEWYACLLNNDCGQNRNQVNGWVNSVALAKSLDGGGSWSLVKSGAAHVVVPPGFTWTGSPQLKNGLYRQGLNHLGTFSPSRIIREGDYFYSIIFLQDRDFSQIHADSHSANMRRYGYVLIRTKDLTKPSSWETWMGGEVFKALDMAHAKVFLLQKSQGNVNAPTPHLIFDKVSKSYVLFVAKFGPTGSVLYATTPSLARPLFSEVKEIVGSESVHPDPRGPHDERNRGFGNMNYISVLDPQSDGLNFEFTTGSPWLFYTVIPTKYGGANLARDLYKIRLRILH